MAKQRKKRDQGAAGGEHWQVYREPSTREVRREDRDAVGDPLPRPAPVSAPLPSAIQEVGAAGTAGTVRVKKRTAVLGAVVLAAAVATTGVVIATRDGHGGSSYSGSQKPIAFAPTLVQARFEAFVHALEKRAGSTLVYSFSAYDGDFSVNVPAAEKGGIPQSYMYYGDSGLRSSGDAGDYVVGRTFDLATLDAPALEGLYKRAWDKAGGKVTSTSLTIKPPKDDGDHWVTIYITHPGDSFYAVHGELDGSWTEGHLVD